MRVQISSSSGRNENASTRFLLVTELFSSCWQNFHRSLISRLARQVALSHFSFLYSQLADKVLNSAQVTGSNPVEEKKACDRVKLCPCSLMDKAAAS